MSAPRGPQRLCRKDGRRVRGCVPSGVPHKKALKTLSFQGFFFWFCFSEHGPKTEKAHKKRTTKNADARKSRKYQNEEGIFRGPLFLMQDFTILSFFCYYNR
ncbi:MAG: hypothetical protein IKU62_09175 [Ruminiclostridium sp.]|nr:hypothetical protein [Ruminiclostridium sp.]